MCAKAHQDYQERELVGNEKGNERVEAASGSLECTLEGSMQREAYLCLVVPSGICLAFVLIGIPLYDITRGQGMIDSKCSVKHCCGF